MLRLKKLFVGIVCVWFMAMVGTIGSLELGRPITTTTIVIDIILSAYTALFLYAQIRKPKRK